MLVTGVVVVSSDGPAGPRGPPTAVLLGYPGVAIKLRPPYPPPPPLPSPSFPFSLPIVFPRDSVVEARGLIQGDGGRLQRWPGWALRTSPWGSGRRFLPFPPFLPVPLLLGGSRRGGGGEERRLFGYSSTDLARL